MATFSINQVRHLYVANNADDINYVLSGDKKTLMFKYNSPDGIIGSDIIDVDKIMYASKTLAGDMKHKFKKHTITISKDPVAGEVYAIKLFFTNYAGGGDDNITVKYADAARGKCFIGSDTVTVSDKNSLAEALRKILDKNLKDLVPLAEVKVTGATAGTIEISEIAQPYEVGVKPFTVMPFTVEIMEAEGDSTWASVEVTETSVDVSGKKIADMEWFYAGARGDMYRGFGHPYGVKTKLVANPGSSYDTIDIHYAYVGPNEGAQKSEKTITIALPAGNAKVTTINDVLAELGVPGVKDSNTNAVLPASAE